jgi:adenylate cyclase
VGGKLNVANILEGSVERSGDRIRIIAHLEKVSDGSHLWSNTYERQTSDLFAVQTELAKAIAENLKAGVSPASKHIPTVEVAEWFMKGRYELQQSTPQSVSRAEADFQHAIDLDPDYAGAYAALAAAKYNQAPARVGDRTDNERRESERLARKALTLDPEMSGPHVTLGFLAMQYDWDWARAEKELQQALSGPPNANANTAYAFLLAFRGRLSEANKYLQQAQDLDPFGTATLSNIAGIRYFQGRSADRRDLARKLLSVAPQMLAAQLMNLSSDVEEGHPELAWPKFQELKQRFPLVSMSEAVARARVGQREEALRLMQPFEEKYPAPGVPMQSFALVYAYFNDEANTVKWLERSADAREWQALNIAVNPAFKSMEQSAGFRALKKKIGLEP